MSARNFSNQLSGKMEVDHRAQLKLNNYVSRETAPYAN